MGVATYMVGVGVGVGGATVFIFLYYLTVASIGDHLS